jgi:hypothetical protein
MDSSIKSNATTNIRAPLDGFNKLYNDILGYWTIKSSATTNITASLEALYKVYDDILGYWTNACLSEYQSRLDDAKSRLDDAKSRLDDATETNSKKQAFIINAWRSILDYIDHNSIIYDSTNKEYITDQQILWNKVQDIVKEKVKEMQSGQITPQTLYYHELAFKEVLEIITNKIKLLKDQEERAQWEAAWNKDEPNRISRKQLEQEAKAIYEEAHKRDAALLAKQFKYRLPDITAVKSFFKKSNKDDDDSYKLPDIKTIMPRFFKKPNKDDDDSFNRDAVAQARYASEGYWGGRTQTRKPKSHRRKPKSQRKKPKLAVKNTNIKTLTNQKDC